MFPVCSYWAQAVHHSGSAVRVLCLRNGQTEPSSSWALIAPSYVLLHAPSASAGHTSASGLPNDTPSSVQLLLLKNLL